MYDHKNNVFRKMMIFCIVIFLLVQLFNLSLISPFIIDFITLSGESLDFKNWYNESTLYVNVIGTAPQILKYNIQSFDEENGVWINKTNEKIVIDNETRHRFAVYVVSYQGWDDIEYINISAWYDNNGTLEDGFEYNHTHGGNYNMQFMYENTSNTTGIFEMKWPNNEVRGFNYSEINITDTFNSDYNLTEVKLVTFEFIPKCQFRYAPGPKNGWKNSRGGPIENHTTYLNNSNSWNFNISVTDFGEDTVSSQTSSVCDEFGVYQYTEIVSAGDPIILGRPDSDLTGEIYTTNSSNDFNDLSRNISIKTVTNGNYSLFVSLSDLVHQDFPEKTIDKNNVYIRGGTRVKKENFTDMGRQVIFLYGNGSGDGSSITEWEKAEVNGTCKYTGEHGDDGLPRLYPNNYNTSSDSANNLRAYNGPNDISHYVEFGCYIESGTFSGKYSSQVFYCLKIQP